MAGALVLVSALASCRSNVTILSTVRELPSRGGAATSQAPSASATAAAAPALPPSARFVVDYSEKLDAATFLNAISDNPRFRRDYLALQDEWRAKIDQEPAVTAAFERWGGRGIQLAYLLSAIPENDLAGTLKRFEDPGSLLAQIEQGLDEPAYAPVFAELKARPEDVRVWLEFLARSGFLEMRQGRLGALAETRQRLGDKLAGLDAAAFVELLQLFSGRPVPERALRLYVLEYSRPFSFQLSGVAVGWSTDKDSFGWLLAHEYLHKYNPSPRTLAAERVLFDKDPFYRESSERIHGEFEAGKEEEIVEGAARYAAEKLGLATQTRNLRELKFLYLSPKTGRSGGFLSALLYDELRRSPPGAGFDYDAFVAGLLESLAAEPGSLGARYRAILAPVSGTAGMVLETDPLGARVKSLLPKLAAARAGLRAGDLVTAIDGAALAGKTREDALDLLAGPPATKHQLAVQRADKSVTIELVLQAPAAK